MPEFYGSQFGAAMPTLKAAPKRTPVDPLMTSLEELVAQVPAPDPMKKYVPIAIGVAAGAGLLLLAYKVMK